MTQKEVISLSDGRKLAYATYGDPEGFPLFYFHGGQESRLSANFMDRTALELGIRIIAPDRPGMGGSSFQPDRRFLDWPKDVVALADALNIDRFSILGLSGGAPHVLACAYAIPERVVWTSIVAGAAPYDFKGSLKGMWFPVKIIHWLATKKKDKGLRKFLQRDYEGLRDKPEKRMKQFQKYLPKPDKALMKAKPEYGWDFIKGSLESYRQGVEGAVHEWRLYVSDWGFELENIQKPVFLWFGTSDKMAPKARAHYLHKVLPQSNLRLLDNEGHFSLIRNHLREILIELKPSSL